ncbi:BrnA antitoxin family protein [Jannaschia sp. LMIT008]|uniref:BrnA antitoxin family protein n=1 Tax=Jannaschia maritima TaxID=3032585 RepID=UPI0028127522|nr:BrnA antitoxin family protein [Jannaschia sp. LMIT008]
MNATEPYTDEDGEVRELDDAFFANAVRGRPPLPPASRKRRMNLMLDPDVIEGLRARGKMSAHVNALLRRDLGLDPAD